MLESQRRQLPEALRLFLHDHPEWENEVSWHTLSDGLQPCLTTNCTLAWVQWCKDTGRCDTAKAARFLRTFEDEITKQLGAES